MQDLYNKLKKYNLDDAINFEESDRQFLALKNLYKNKKISNEIYLFLIIINALISYQLSWKWEDYWEEFSSALENKNFNNFEDIYNFFEDFLKNSKNNRRFVEMKLKRIKKIENFYIDFISKTEYYYKNMDKLALDLAKVMNQKVEAKTIVFAVKMFSYWARNVFQYLEYFPENLMIPIDSRLENLYKKYSPPILAFPPEGERNKQKQIKKFYINLSKKLNIPLLHLDAILWVNYNELIK